MDDNKTEVLSIDINHACNIFGHNDVHMKTIEKELGVDIFSQNGDMVVRGKESAVNNARKVLDTLQELSKRGNEILEQNVNYAVEMAASSEDTEKLIDIDKEIICHTVAGKPVKPKTLGQKQYVDAIKNNMVVFGMGPAGTGKTYLAMAMAITAFKNNEVERIILTRQP